MQAGLLAGNREFSSCQVSRRGLWCEFVIVWGEYSLVFLNY